MLKTANTRLTWKTKWTWKIWSNLPYKNDLSRICFRKSRSAYDGYSMGSPNCCFSVGSLGTLADGSAERLVGD